MRTAGSDDEGKVVTRKEKGDWNIDYSGEKPTTPLLDSINYPLHMKNLSTEVSVFMVLILFSSFLCVSLLFREIVMWVFMAFPFYVWKTESVLKLRSC